MFKFCEINLIFIYSVVLIVNGTFPSKSLHTQKHLMGDFPDSMTYSCQRSLPKIAISRIWRWVILLFISDIIAFNLEAYSCLSRYS